MHVQEEMHGKETRALKLERKRLEHEGDGVKSLKLKSHKTGAQDAGAQEVEEKRLEHEVNGAQEARVQEAGAQEAGAQEAGAQEAGAQKREHRIWSTRARAQNLEH